MHQESTKTTNLSVPKKLKILFIGNSFAVDATWHLADIALAMGVEQIKVGTLHANGFVSVGIEDPNCVGEEREEVKAKATYYIDSYKNWEKVLK